MADRHIMIQCINDQSDIFTQIAADIVVSCEKLRILINKVCSKQFIKGSFCVCGVEFFHSLCEESESCADKDLTGTTFFQKRCNLQNAAS